MVSSYRERWKCRFMNRKQWNEVSGSGMLRWFSRSMVELRLDLDGDGAEKEGPVPQVRI